MLTTPTITFNQPIQAELTKNHSSLEYSVKLPSTGNLAISLTNLTGNADLVLKNSDHQAITLFGIDQVASKNDGVASEYLNYQEFAYASSPEGVTLLKAGTYYVEVNLGEGSDTAKYTLEVSEQFENHDFKVGEVKNFFNYRAILSNSPQTYKFHVGQEDVYSFAAITADPDLMPDLKLVSADGKHSHKSKMSEGIMTFSEIKEVSLPAGDYTLTVVPKDKKKEVQYLVSGISKKHQEKMLAQQMPLVPTEQDKPASDLSE